MKLETVKIVTENGPVIINKSDFDEEKHELYVEPKAKKVEEPKAEEPKAEEPKAEEPKAEEPKAADPAGAAEEEPVEPAEERKSLADSPEYQARLAALRAKKE
jgi:hypothetical protein